MYQVTIKDNVQLLFQLPKIKLRKYTDFLMAFIIFSRIQCKVQVSSCKCLGAVIYTGATRVPIQSTNSLHQIIMSLSPL